MAPLKNEDRSKNGCNQRNRSVRKIMRKVNRFRIDLVPLIYSAFRFSVATASSVEQCVDQLRDAPSIFKGSIKFENYNYSRIWIADEEISKQFSSCINAATVPVEAKERVLIEINNSYSVRDDDFKEFIQNKGEGFKEFIKENPEHAGTFIEDDSYKSRYLFSDGYQRKYLLDVVEKRSYELVRIPPLGRIESRGTWDGTYKDPLYLCQNSYGDSCGTAYQRNAAGGYDKKK